jgi:hypothetical protein
LAPVPLDQPPYTGAKADETIRTKVELEMSTAYAKSKGAKKK